MPVIIILSRKMTISSRLVYAISFADMDSLIKDEGEATSVSLPGLFTSIPKGIASQVWAFAVRIKF